MRGGKKERLYFVLVSLALSLALSCLIILARNQGMLERIELGAYDAYCRAAAQSSHSEEPRIVIVAISEADIKGLGHWPVNDRVLAELLNRVENDSPRVIGLDMYRDIPVPPGGQALRAVFRRHKNIVGIKKIGDASNTGVGSPYVAAVDGAVGFNDIVVDRDGIVRRGLLYLDTETGPEQSFPLLAALLFLGKEGVVLKPDSANAEHMRIGLTSFIPLESRDGGYTTMDSRGYQYLLDYRKGLPRFQTIPLREVLSKRMPIGTFRDKIVLIGVTAESLKDFFYVPFHRGEVYQNRVSGIELQGLMIRHLLLASAGQVAPFNFLPDRFEWMLIIVIGLIGAAAGSLSRSPWHLALIIIPVVGIIITASHVMFMGGWWIPIIPPLMTGIGSHIAAGAVGVYKEKQQKHALMNLFERHLSKDVASAIWAKREQFMEGGRPKPQALTATVLFTDLQGFTTIAERLDPHSLVTWLNGYMEAMTEIIEAHGGVINKYIGDAIMVIFGVPVPRISDQEIKKDAENAVSCAVAMAASLQDINRGFSANGLPAMKMRIGIYTGELVAGTIGSARRMEYTVLGDTVNIASRLESFDKSLLATSSDTRILIGEMTAELVRHRFELDTIGTMAIKGKETKIPIYHVIGEKQ